MAEAADVYSLALTRTSAGPASTRSPRGTPAETARRIGEPLPPLRDHRPDLPEGLAAGDRRLPRPEPARRALALVELRASWSGPSAGLDDGPALPVRGTETERRPHRRALPRGAPSSSPCARRPRSPLVAGPLGRPGLALVLGAVQRCPRSSSPRASPRCRARARAGCSARSSAAPAYPAVGAARADACVERAVLGGARLVVLAAAAGARSRRDRPGPGSAPAPTAGSRDGAPRPSDVLAPLLEPSRSSAPRSSPPPRARWVVLRAGTSPWRSWGRCSGRPASSAALRVVADGRLAGRPVLVAAAAVGGDRRVSAAPPRGPAGPDPGSGRSAAAARPGRAISAAGARSRRRRPRTFAGDPLGFTPPGLGDCPARLPATPEDPDQRSAKPGAADREPRRGRVQPRLLVAGSAGRDRPQAGEGDGRPPNRLGFARLRAEPVHGLALGRGPRAPRGLRALARAGAVGLPARARPPPRLRAADAPRRWTSRPTSACASASSGSRPAW